MITAEHQNMLRDAAASNDKEAIYSAFQKVMKEEICTIRNFNQLTQDYLCNIANLMSLPFKTEVKVVKSQESGVLSNQPAKSQKKEIHLAASFAALLGVSALSAKVGVWYGIGLSAVIAVGSYVYAKTSKKHQEKEPEMPASPVPKITEVYSIEADTLIELADKLKKNMNDLVGELVIENGKTTVQLPLHECYPNVLDWLQTVYSDALDFDEPAKKYLLKRIDSLANECYYDLVVYDGNNEDLFKQYNSSGIEHVEMVAPSFVYKKTGKMVFSGTIAIPSK